MTVAYPPLSACGVGVSSAARGVNADSRARVLIVDDEPSLLTNLTQLLTRAGFETETASSGGEAIAKLDTGDFSMVLSDISMPGMTGVQLLEAVRTGGGQIPVVLMTGKLSFSTAVKAIEHGACHYLTKPFSKQDLLAALDKAYALHCTELLQRTAADSVARQDAATARAFARVLRDFWIAYQPIVWASTGKVYGYEALLRSNEPLLPTPLAVIDVAERLAQARMLGRRVRQRAAEPMLQLATDHVLFVNLHPIEMGDPELVSANSRLTAMAARVVLEITERSSVACIQNLKQHARELRSLGFRLAVDDMGSGFAGLTSLHALEPEVVKLDMALIRGIHQDATKRRLVRHVVELCKDMNSLVVAEGVEYAEELSALQDLGCDLLQGYLFAKPARTFTSVSWDPQARQS